MAFWRKHIWEDRGIVLKGSILISGIFEGRQSFITTNSDSTKFECLKCGNVIHIIGSGKPQSFGCTPHTVPIGVPERP